jgi:hypothetical protein
MFHWNFNERFLRQLRLQFRQLKRSADAFSTLTEVRIETILYNPVSSAARGIGHVTFDRMILPRHYYSKRIDRHRALSRTRGLDVIDVLAVVFAFVAVDVDVSMRID